MCDDCEYDSEPWQFSRRIEGIVILYNQFRATKEIEKLDEVELEVEQLNEDFEMNLGLLDVVDFRRAYLGKQALSKR